MTDRMLDEMRRQMANLQAELEFSMAAVEMLPVESGSSAAEGKRAEVLEQLRSVQRNYELIADAMGGVPKPVRH